MVKKKIPDIPGFYNLFKIGIEIEGEFYHSMYEMEEMLGEFDLAEDGSIRNEQFSDENGCELKSGIIANDELERVVYRDLQRIVPENKSVFSVPNTSCGTHIHFSFNNSNFTDEDLYVFDTKDFEVYFFKKYMQYFTRKKFFDRINGTNYAMQTLWFSPAKSKSAQKLGKKIIIDKRKENNLDVPHTIATTIRRKNDSSRYFWFNTCAINSGYGAEIRIFPYLQSVAGVKEVVAFTKYVLYSYFMMKKTQRILSLVRKYPELRGKYSIDFKKLNEFEQIVASEMGLHKFVESNITSPYPRYNEIPRGDVRMLIGRLYNSRPNAFIKL